MLETRNIPENIEFETIRYCDLCGGSRFLLWDRARSVLLSRCQDCGLIFTNPRIAKSTDKDQVLYTRSYFDQKSRMTKDLVAARKQTYEREITTLSQFVTQGKILDVGCGMGLFLESFSSSWDKHGCDVSSYALEEAKARGIQTYHGEFENLDFPSASFDVVYFRASLHHAYYPSKCLQKAFQILKPGGTLAICMSNNVSGLGGLLFKAHIRSFEQAHHYLFSSNTLRSYLKRFGFKILKTQYPYFGTGYNSMADLFKLPKTYASYVKLRFLGRLGTLNTFDFNSPALYGNYINVYAQKPIL